MKTTIKLIVLTMAMFAISSQVSAQTIKLAHINLEELVSSMPEYGEAREKLQKVVKDIEDELELIKVELNRKYEEYLSKRETWTALVLQSKEQELQMMNQRLQMTQESAQESYQMEMEKIMQPIYEKANKAIETVAKEQGITYVISGNPQILIFKAVGTLDLLPLVKQHLGIKN